MGSNNSLVRTKKIALFTCLACFFQISESLLVLPVPGFRVGFANAMTLVALVDMGFGAALTVALMRTFITSLLIGTFLSPTFILSFGAAVSSACVMGLLYKVSSLSKMFGLSLTGVSIVGAVCHNLAQLYLVYLLLIPHKGIFVFLPWLCCGAVITGKLTAMLASGIYEKIKNPVFVEERLSILRDTPGLSEQVLPASKPIETFIHRVPAVLKLFCFLVISLIVLFWPNLLFITAAVLALASVFIFCRISFKRLLSNKQYIILVSAAFFLPALFNAGSHVFFRAAIFKFSYEGLMLGATYAARIVLFILMSALLVATTPPESWRLPGRQMAAVFYFSWAAFPSFCQSAQKIFSFKKMHEMNGIRGISSKFGDFVAELYLQAESGSLFS